MAVPGPAGHEPVRPWRSAAGQMAVTSGVTLTFECFCGHQLEYLKILRQTTMQPYGVILRDILARKGVMGLWDGFVPWGLLQSVSKGAVFGLANANIKRGLRAEPGSAQRYRFGLSPGLADTIAGAGAGGVQGLVLSPTLLLKTRVMTDPRYHAATSGNVSAARASLESFRLGTRVITDEGVGSLMKGAGTFAAKRVGDWGTRFALTNAAESALFGRHHGLSYLQQIQASLIGGFLSALSTIPLDVAVANLQAASSAGAASGRRRTRKTESVSLFPRSRVAALRFSVANARSRSRPCASVEKDYSAYKGVQTQSAVFREIIPRDRVLS